MDVDKALKSIGKECFVLYFHTFADNTISKCDIVEMLIANHGYKETATKTRVSNARSIISNGMAKEALMTIGNSKNISDKIRNEAKQLIKNI